MVMMMMIVVVIHLHMCVHVCCLCVCPCALVCRFSCPCLHSEAITGLWVSTGHLTNWSCLFGVGWPASARSSCVCPVLQSHAECLPFYVSAGDRAQVPVLAERALLSTVQLSNSGVAFTFEEIKFSPFTFICKKLRDNSVWCILTWL